MRDAKSDDGADWMAEYSAEKESAPGVVIGLMPSMCLQRVLFRSLALDKLCAVCVLQIRALFCKVMSQPLKWPLKPYKLSRC